MRKPIINYYNYHVGHVDAIRRRCRKIGASAAPGFWSCRIYRLQGIYNGIGPEAWSPHFRAWVTRTLDRFEVAALPHDYEYATAPRTYLHFTIANARFAVNACLEAWYSRRWRLAPEGFLLAILCQCFGWSGFRSYHINNKRG